MPLANDDVVANSQIHRDVVEIPVAALQHQSAAPCDERLCLHLGVMELQAESVPSTNVDELRTVRRVRRRQQYLVSPWLSDSVAMRCQRELSVIVLRHRGQPGLGPLRHAWCQAV